MFWCLDDPFNKRLQKVAQFVKHQEKSSIWPNFETFWTNYHVWVFRWTFQQKVAKSGLIRQKARKIMDLTKTLQLFEQTTMSLHFDELFRKKFQKVPHFVKKHENSPIWPKLWPFFEKTTMFWCFDELLSESFQKVAQFMKKHEKSSIWPKLCIFSNKLPCLCISMNFSGESCKKCFVSWKSTKNHRFGQIFNNFSSKLPCFGISMKFSAKSYIKCLISWKSTKNRRFWRKLATSPTNYHVLTLWWTFQRKVAESASFSEKTLKINDWAKTCNFFEQSTIFMRFDELFSKRLRKVPRVVTKHEKSSIWPKLATFRTNYHVLAFSWTFQQKVAKSASFGEKAREIIDLAKTIQLFQQTTMILHFDELLRKRWEKVVHFVKKHENSRTWSKLATFRENYHVLTFRCTFQQTVAKTASFREKARKLIDLAKTMQLYGTKYHVLVFRWTFQPKAAKSGSIREKARKIIDLAKPLQLLEQTTMSLHFDELFRKKLIKVPHFVEKDEKPWIWPKLSTSRANYHVLAFSWIFQQQVAKSASFRGKAREIIDLAKTMQLFRTNFHVFAFRSTFREKVAESASFRETARKTIDLAKALQLLEQATMSFSFWWTFKKKVAKSASSREKARKIIDFVNLQLSEKTTMFWRFDEHCSKNLQKAARAVKKHEKSSIWPNLCNFSKKLRFFCISMNFQGKSCQKCFVSWKSTKNHRFGQNLATFRTKYHVYAFRWTFQQKVAKSASFREKARKIIDLAKTCNFSTKLPCFGISMNFSGKKCKKWPVSWKSTNTHRFGQNLQLLEETTMFWHFDDYCRKKLQKGGKSGSFREKWRKIIDLA